MDHIVQWLFTDPQSATGDAAHPEQFHFWVPWIIFCALGLLIPFYYRVEGRKRFFGGHALHKYLLDKFGNQLALVAFVGWLVMGARAFMDSSLFSWRIWRYGWLLWVAIIVGYWTYYMIRRYPAEIQQYRRHRTMQQYVPQPKQKRRAARAGAR
jgi:hypothetical protein